MRKTLARLFTFTTIALTVTAACQSDEPSDQDRLQSLLHDAPLTHVPPGADAVARPAGAGEAVAGGDHSNIVLPSDNPLGVWNFDDCNSSRTNLSDSTFNNNMAFRSVGVTCTDGIQNSRAVSIAAPEDLVYVPDQPNFTFDTGVTVAGWFKPSATGGAKTLFRKRDKGTSSFALLLDAGKFEFVVNLGNDTAISVLSPQKAKLGAYQHVAATYDGTTARLYVNGFEVNSFAASGTIPLGPGPLLIGNDGSERRYNGAIDSALFATHALTADEVQALTCFPQFPTLVVTPQSPSAAPGETARVDFAITNHNPAACAPLVFTLNTEFSDSRLTLDPPPFRSVKSDPIPSGATGHMTVSATPNDSVDPGTSLFFDLEITEPVTGFFSFPFLQLQVVEPTGCHVSTPRELMIKSTTVVDDSIRTVFNASSSDARNGVWTFKHLMENVAATPADAPAMVEAMLDTFTVPQTINGFTVQARPGMQSFILDTWPRTSDGALDLAQAPLRLAAIVNRFDLRDLGNGDAGEARFVFSFVDPFFTFFSLQANLILEYKLPATTEQDVESWASSFHALGALPFGDSYNAALQAITERFAGRNARPDHPGGSAISAVRSNELDFSGNGLWEMRSFALSATSGRLEPVPLVLTPDRGFTNTSALASYINANQDAIIAEKHTVPALFNGQPFQAGAVFNNLATLFAPGVNSDARFHFALNTCNGCHSSAETGTFFTQIAPRNAGQEASLSGFLTGITVSDPATGQLRTLNDLHRRNLDLEAVVCAPQSIAPAQLRKGIQRVH
jgi:hypothetical protein